jgi:hypothetical protein
MVWEVINNFDFSFVLLVVIKAQLIQDIQQNSSAHKAIR